MFYKLSYQEQIRLLDLFLEKYPQYRNSIPSTRYYALFGHIGNTHEDIKIRNLLEDIAKIYLEHDKPFSKILNINIFRNRSFFVNDHVLDPRPETEQIIDILQLVNFQPKSKILELGVGSGVISISAKLEFPDLDIRAIDISDEALKVAKHNSKIHGTTIKFLKNNWLEGVEDFYDICISNPPYLYENEMKMYPELAYDPDIALLGSDLYFYREIAKKKHFFNHIILEIHPRDSGILQDLFSNSVIFQDFNNLDRFLYYSKL